MLNDKLGLSVHQNVKHAFDATVAGQNKGAIMVELIDNALALLQATAQASVQCLQPAHFLAELAAVLARLKAGTAQGECRAAGRTLFRCRAGRYGLLALNSA